MANDLLHTTAEQLVTNLAIRDLVSGQTKSASDTEPSYAFSGQLYATDSGWIMLSVPNALVRGAFSAMTEPGLELPFNKEGKLNAHISVFRPEELEEVGGIEKVTERGKTFRYSVGRFVSTVPAGWSSMARVWFFTVHSPELQALRRSYGLSSLPNKGDFDFHVTVAVRRRGVLGRNTTKKSCEECADESFAPPTSVRQKVAALTPDQVKERFTPDLGVKELQSRGVYSRMYGSDPKARLASMLDWPKEWFTDNDPRGWLDWYEKYQDGRRDEDDDRQMRRWSSFKARHGAQFKRNPTPRRAYALQNWAIDPASMVADEQKDRVRTDMESYAVAKDAKRLKIASKRFTVCVDFDGTLAEQEKPFRIGSAGPPRKKNVALVNELHKEGVRIVVWTVRNNVKFLRKYLKDNKIEYDYINENPDQPPNGSKKLIADIYLDDRGVDARDEGKAEKEVMTRFKAWKDDEPEKTAETEEEVDQPSRTLTSYVPRNTLTSVRKNGLLGGKALIENPDALLAAAAGRGVTPEEFKAGVQKTINSWKKYQALGPNAFFHPPPATTQLSDNHPSKQHDLVPLKIRIDDLVRDVPDTKIYGMELEPYNATKHTAGTERHRYLQPKDVSRLLGKTPEELWANYADPENVGYYGPDVPHTSVHTPDSVILAKYLDFPEDENG